MPCFDTYFIPAICFFRWDISVIFLLRHCGHWDISVISLTVVLNLTITVFISLYFPTFWPNWLQFFRSFWKHVCLWPKKIQPPICASLTIAKNIINRKFLIWFQCWKSYMTSEFSAFDNFFLSCKNKLTCHLLSIFFIASERRWLFYKARL